MKKPVLELVQEITVDAHEQEAHWARGSYSRSLKFFTSSDLAELAKQWRQQRIVIGQWAAHRPNCDLWEEGGCTCGLQGALAALHESGE
ncbi:MAG: hypothetical protein ACYS7Y_33375 [Planctomycetota bacterium]|jgi:hypothetical protein